MEFWRALEVGQVKLREMQGAVLQCRRRLGQKKRTSGMWVAGEEWAGTILEWRHERNRSLNGGKIVFHALFGVSQHSDQENGIFSSSFFKYLQFGMSTGLGREGTARLSTSSKSEDAVSCCFSVSFCPVCAP